MDASLRVPISKTIWQHSSKFCLNKILISTNSCLVTSVSFPYESLIPKPVSQRIVSDVYHNFWVLQVPELSNNDKQQTRHIRDSSSAENDSNRSSTPSEWKRYAYTGKDNKTAGKRYMHKIPGDCTHTSKEQNHNAQHLTTKTQKIGCLWAICKTMKTAIGSVEEDCFCR